MAEWTYAHGSPGSINTNEKRAGSAPRPNSARNYCNLRTATSTRLRTGGLPGTAVLSLVYRKFFADIVDPIVKNCVDALQRQLGIKKAPSGTPLHHAGFSSAGLHN